LAVLDVTAENRGMNTPMTSVQLDWSSAEVEDSDLTVALEGSVSKAWKGRFENTVRLLGHRDWGDIRLRKGKVRVSDVTPGGEEKLRHHLEAIVVQANAHEQAEEEADSPPDPGAETHQQQDHGPDAEMTARFRSCGEKRADPGDAT
jgi:hypothetical protein